VAACLLLGLCGAKNPDDPVVALGSDTLLVEYTDEAGLAGSRQFESYTEAAAFKATLAPTAGATMAIKPAAAFTYKTLSQILTLYYFAYFLLVLPMLALTETPKRVPESIAKSVLGHKKAEASPVPAE
jgi:ubiquinol-cytochrome c reductase cytochrome b subunit